MTKFLTTDAGSAQAKASRAGLAKKMLAGLLVAGLMVPAFAGAASAAPFGIAPAPVNSPSPITKVEWHRHDDGAVAGALIGLGILGIGAAAIAAQQQQDQQYYYAPAYPQPYYAAPAYYGAPVYYGAPRYEGRDGDHWRHVEYHHGGRDPYPNPRDQRFNH